MPTVGKASTGSKPVAAETPKETPKVTSGSTATTAESPDVQPQAAETPEKPMTEETKAQRKQDKQMSGVMKLIAIPN